MPPQTDLLDCTGCDLQHAIAAYSQGLADELLGVDGSEEFTVYMSPVGKI